MKKLFVALAALFAPAALSAAELKAGDPAPPFTAKTDQGKPFDLKERAGKWTVLYFYPKSGTPGCTKQACAFRDALEPIGKLGAEVFGISKDSVKNQKKFVEKHKLTFTLLADPDGKILSAYGAKGMLGWAKRWTFILGPDLKVRWVEKDVDPALDAEKVAEALRKLQAS
ncbi:MAG TPA: peroxiredoxin [Elusimicrobia bacterium]|nr:peroxiredoxin [Elusimicrobiota bacterium]